MSQNSPKRPPKVQGGYEKVYAIGQIRFNKDRTKMQVKLNDENKPRTITEWPDFAVAGEWSLTLNDKLDRLMGLKPIEGRFKGKVVEFIAEEGQKPVPLYKDKGDYRYQYFLVLLELTQPEKFCGIQFVVPFRYNFREYTDDEGSWVTVASKGRHTQMLDDFCFVTGAWNYGYIPWSDNVLPAVQKRILHAEQEFEFLMEDGWISEFNKFSVEPREEFVDDLDSDTALWDDKRSLDDSEENVSFDDETDDTEFDWED